MQVSATWTRNALTGKIDYAVYSSPSDIPEMIFGIDAKYEARNECINEQIGRYLRSKYRRILAESGDYYMAARNLRRQGYPLAIARLILFGRA